MTPPRVTHRYRFSSEGLGAPPPPPDGSTLISSPEQQAGVGEPTVTGLQSELERMRQLVKTEQGRTKASAEEARKNAEAAKKLSEIEEAQKSTEERLTGKVGKLEGDLKTASDEIARLTAAIKFGLGEDDLVLLPRGLGADEVSAAAKRLADRGGPSQQQPPDFDGGPRSKAPGSDWDTQMRDAMRNRRR